MPQNPGEHFLACTCPLLSERGHPLYVHLVYSVQWTLGVWAGADSETRALSFPRILPGHRQTQKDSAGPSTPNPVGLWFAAALQLTPSQIQTPVASPTEPHLPGPTLSPKTPILNPCPSG